ncbi:MAG: protein-L-isoaspartate O-methyltransferase family protein [Rubricella sp.]
MIDYAAARTTMVDTQVRPSDVTRYPIIAAMLEIPREQFVPTEAKPIAYADDPIELSAERSILAPRTLAKMIDALELGKNDLVLDIGPAHGYSTAVLARIAGTIVGVEEDESLARSAAETLSEIGVDNAIIENRPLVEGAPEHGPFDVIVLQGAAETLPDALVAQLREDGRIVMLKAEGVLCYAVLGVKGAAGISWRRIFDAAAPVLPGFSAERGFLF